MGVFDAFQVPYSALQREHEGVIDRASKAGAGIIIRGGVARGSPTDWEERRYYMLSADDLRNRWEQAKLDDLLDGMSRMEFMLRFTLSDPDLDTTIVGTKSLEHLRGQRRGGAQGPAAGGRRRGGEAQAKRGRVAAGVSREGQCYRLTLIFTDVVRRIWEPIPGAGGLMPQTDTDSH